MRHRAYLILSIVFAGLVLAKFNPSTGMTSLIRFGETWQNRRLPALNGLPIATLPGSNGYDGQFYAQLAIDPLLRDPHLAQAIDAPSYRARRILLPDAAALLGLGNPWWTLQAYALLNVVCWFVLGWLLYKHIGSTSWMSIAQWAGCMLSMGVLDSVRQSLVDLPALLLLTLAICAWAPEQPSRATLWLTLGNLAKETDLLGMLALTGHQMMNKARRWSTFGLLTVAVMPLALWSLYVHQHLPSSGSTEGFGNFTWPLVGVITQAELCLRAVLNGNWDSRYTFGLISILSLGTQAVVLWRRPEAASAWWRVGAAYSLLLPFLGPWVWSGYWAACRAVLPMTVAFNLLLPKNRSFWPIWVIGNLTLLHAVWRFL